jgi:hypothetical protein
MYSQGEVANVHIFHPRCCVPAYMQPIQCTGSQGKMATYRYISHGIFSSGVARKSIGSIWPGFESHFFNSRAKTTELHCMDITLLSLIFNIQYVCIFNISKQWMGSLNKK